MSDDLKELKQAMDAATPVPDASVKAAHLALAQKNFDDLQGSRQPARPMSNRPFRGLWTGAIAMLNTLSSRAVMTATTAFVACGFVVVNFTDLDQWSLPGGGLPVTSDEVTAVTLPAQPGEDRVSESEAIKTEIQPAPAPETALGIAESDDALPTTRLRQNLSAESGAIVSKRMAGTAPAAAGLAADHGGAFLDQRLEAPVGSMLQPNTEEFSNEASSPLQITAESPVSTFSIDVDTASYAVVRNSLMNGYLPAPESVRVEEMINYFPYDYPAPEGAAFSTSVSVSTTPWNPDTQLVHIGIQGALPEVEDRPPLNLVFLIDTSGSMNDANKLPLLKQSFRLMLGQLRPEDQVSIVTYAGSAGQVLEPTDASERSVILNALDQLGAGGSTAGQAGLQQAYATAAAMAENGEVTRVILATDGDFNVGIADPAALKTYIADKRDSGIYLSVLGFGRGNLDDATMQALAQNGNGTAAYIDTLAEAQKVLVDQLTGALFPIADDVKIQVEFNPAQIAEYRLIGYETRALRREDFNNDAVDAGDIGAGHTVTALYEITPVGSPAQLSTPLRYQAEADTSDRGGDELGYFALRYKAPGETASQLIETPITADMPALPDAGFATAIAGFGQLLRGSDYVTDWSYEDAIALALSTKGDDTHGYRAEAIQLMRLAASLSEN